MTEIVRDITITIANLLHRILEITELAFTGIHTFIEDRFSSWVPKATTIRIDLWTSQYYNEINENLYPLVLKVLDYEYHHLKKSEIFSCIMKQIPLVYDQ